MAHKLLAFLVRPNTCGIVALDKVKVPQYAPVIKRIDHVKHFLVVRGVVLVLRAPPLKLARPKLLVAHLVDGQDDEVERAREAVEQGVVAVLRVRLHAKFQTAAHFKPAGVALACLHDGGDVALVVHIGGGYAFDYGRQRRVAAELVHIRLDAVIDVIGDADLIEAAVYGVAADRVERIDGIVRKLGMDMVVGKHMIPP